MSEKKEENFKSVKERIFQIYYYTTKSNVRLGWGSTIKWKISCGIHSGCLAEFLTEVRCFWSGIQLKFIRTTGLNSIKSN